MKTIFADKKGLEINLYYIATAIFIMFLLISILYLIKTGFLSGANDLFKNILL